MFSFLLKVGNIALSPFKPYPNLELSLIYGVFPGILDAMQFWVFDNILKAENSNDKNESETGYLEFSDLLSIRDEEENLNSSKYSDGYKINTNLVLIKTKRYEKYFDNK